MKKLWFLFPVLLAGLYACHQEKRQAPVVIDPYYQKALSFLYRQNDSAFYYFNKVAGSSKDSLQIARSYNQMAAILSDVGDDFGSQENLLTSLKFLNEADEKNRKCLSSDYNELGVTSFNLRNYDAAIDFYDRALGFCDNPKLKAIILNNQANAYQRKKDYARALKLYQANITQVKVNGIEYARILSNMAKTRWLQHPSYHAAPEMLKALQIRKSENDLLGQNASYMHLTDYYTASHPDSALFYAGEMYQVAQRLNSADDRLYALRKLVGLSAPQDARRYFGRYQELDDSIKTARNAAKNQFALIRYDAQKAKADNLKLQKENTDKKYEITKQWFILDIILFIVAAGIMIAIIWYRKRKQLLALETRNAISKKVHDVVANGLYRFMKEVQYGDNPDKEVLLDKIEPLYERSRNISYDPVPNTAQGFQETIAGLLKPFSNETTRVFIAGNNSELWDKMNAHTRYELEHVLQELMVNMSKHSGATNVAVKFEEQPGRILISYTDDGAGLPANFIYGNGLKNTVSRIKDIRGELSFGNNLEKGLKISISFPIV